MARKNTHNTKGKIIEAAWDLFYRQGYDDTTVEEIIAASGTSRGSFYHYFSRKSDLLVGLLSLVDEALEETVFPSLTHPDQREDLRLLEHASEAYVAAQLERGFRTLDFYKSLASALSDPGKT